MAIRSLTFHFSPLRAQNGPKINQKSRKLVSEGLLFETIVFSSILGRFFSILVDFLMNLTIGEVCFVCAGPHETHFAEQYYFRATAKYFSPILLISSCFLNPKQREINKKTLQKCSKKHASKKNMCSVNVLLSKIYQKRDPRGALFSLKMDDTQRLFDFLVRLWSLVG